MKYNAFVKEKKRISNNESIRTKNSGKQKKQQQHQVENIYKYDMY